jgi:hypothetical protein
MIHFATLGSTDHADKALVSQGTQRYLDRCGDVGELDRRSQETMRTPSGAVALQAG